ncbi:MAG: tetratricopeptide repeat protein, partial [Phycisphaerales bacterium]
MADRIATIREMLETEPDDPMLRYSLAFELAKIGEEDEAIEWYARCLEVDPDYHYAAYHQARTLDAAGRTDDAIAAARAQLPRAQAAGDGKAA